MKLNEWRKAQRERAVEAAVPLLLPSGLEILARRPEPAHLAMWGQLPTRLAGAVAGVAARDLSDAEVLDVMNFSRKVLEFCMVKPRLSANPQGEDEMHPSELPDGDMAFLMKWARRGEEVDALRSFRDGGSDGDAGGDREEHADAAFDTAGGRGHGGGPGSGRRGDHVVGGTRNVRIG